MVAFSIVENRVFSFVKKRHARVKIIIRALLNVAFDGFAACSFEFDQVADSVLAPVAEALAPEARFAAAKLHAILNSIFISPFSKLKISKSHFLFTPKDRKSFMHSYTIYIAGKKCIRKVQYSLWSIIEDEKGLPEHCQQDNAGQNRNPAHLARSYARETQTCRILELTFLFSGFKNNISQKNLRLSLWVK